jgi:hypothetical protein
MIKRLFLPALLVILLTACGAPPELRNPDYLTDTSLIDSEPCGAPCFRGITPGETQWRNALTILEDDTFLTDVNITEDQDSEGIAATFQRVDGIPCCLVYSEDGTTVSQILLQLAPDMTVSQVLDTLGDPAYVSGAELSPEQASIALYYPEKQTIVYSFVAGQTGQLTANSEIFAVLYVEPAAMEDVITYSDLYAWRGYQSYAGYIDGEYDKTAAPTLEPTEEAGQ